MASVAHIVLLIHALYTSLRDQAPDDELDLVGATEHLVATYRQSPLLSSQTRVAITTVLNPLSKRVQFPKCMANPLGLAMQCQTPSESLNRQSEQFVVSYFW
jgi:hypothetical protein